MGRTNLIALRHKRLVGDFDDDLYSEDRQRLEFYRWLYLDGRLNEGLPVLSRFERLIAELKGVPAWQSI